MAKEVSQRVQLLINHYYNGNKTQFAKKVGVLPQAVNQWIKAGVAISSLEKIYAAFPEVDKNWLFYGMGTMFGESNGIFNSPNSGNVDSFNNSTIEGSSALVETLRQQIQDLKDQIDKKDEQIQNLIDLMMKK